MNNQQKKEPTYTMAIDSFRREAPATRHGRLMPKLI